MIKEKLKKILTVNGVSLIIGILGSLASIMTVFVTQWNSQINVKWFVLTVFIAIALLLIFFKLVFDLNNEIKRKRPNTIKVLRYIPESTTFLIEKNETLGYSAMVSIFYIDDNYETEFGKGYVKNIQDEFIQIKLLDVTNDFKTNYQDKLQKIDNNDINILNKLLVKSYIKYTK